MNTSMFTQFLVRCNIMRTGLQKALQRALQKPIHLLCLLALAHICTSCVVVRMQHVGRSYPPSPTIDVVYAQRDIKVEKYEFIGEILMEVHNGFILPEMEARLVEEARARGANAVIIGNLDVRFFNDGFNNVSGANGMYVTTDQGNAVRLVRGYLVRYL